MGVSRQGWSGAFRLGAKAMTGVLAAGVVLGVGSPQVASAEPAPPAPVRVDAPRVAASEPLRVMPLGDSITRGTGAPSGSSYRKTLAERLRKGGLRINYVGSQRNGVSSDNNHEGHGGWNIGELAAHLDGWLAASRPDVVLLHVGTNNIKEGHSPASIARKLSAMIDQIRAARPEAHIFVAQIVTSRLPREAADARVYNRMIPTLVADKNDARITVVDQSSVGGIDLHDLRHPNEFGYSKMAWNWYQAMAPVLGTSGYTGANPYKMRRAVRCLLRTVTVGGESQQRTECLTWTLRTTTIQVNGVNRRVRAWLTLRETPQTYRVRVNGKLKTRTRTVQRWTGPGDLLNL
ncbi:SGNH/GDSL hydrolase family protein [Actinoplanes sp. NPDC051346]|uniref:SGNH/GDSL hydrolase family protein n=1 Tax=Actinoplanes sp. NPDC051346 TaxID=3155048 RepID=UPI003430CBDA